MAREIQRRGALDVLRNGVIGVIFSPWCANCITVSKMKTRWIWPSFSTAFPSSRPN